MGQHSTDTDYEQGTNLLDTVTVKAAARYEHKDKLDRLPGVKHFIVLTGHGHNLLQYYNKTNETFYN